ncbi:MAG: glycerol kinase [Rickettsiales bacterium]|jgi:glycerol kinase|nr:glycerol kinase [Rickettsiales bacterium]
MESYLLAIDEGTTSSRAIVFDAKGEIVSLAQTEFTQHYPNNGWVEHDPEELWEATLNVCRKAISEAGRPIASIGITNQRETTVIWERKSGQAIYPAIVWQDRRTAEMCEQLKAAGHEKIIHRKTGLLLDPYFSATKIAWILDNVKGARARAENGELAFGTIDTFILWRLTEAKVHATDATNASRTSLFNINTQQWDDALLKLFNIPASLLPEVKDSAADFGTTRLLTEDKSAIAIGGIAGDQQAATIGQACFAPGMVKSTYGTGCFMVANTGDTPCYSQHQLLTTIAYRLNGKPTYALEGSIFIAGAAVQWLRDKLHLITHAKETDALAASLSDNCGVYLVPAFTGLGAPHWDANARGAIFGVTRDTGIAEIVRATLESVVYQTCDLLNAMAKDGLSLHSLRVDGGMVKSDWLCQFLSDMGNVSVKQPKVLETTAWGAVCLAGLQAGIYRDLEDISALWLETKIFTPSEEGRHRKTLLVQWDKAVAAARQFSGSQG